MEMHNTIQVWGDSISLGYGLENVDQSYVSILQRHLETEIDVYAECGRTIQDLIRILPEIVSHKYNISIVFIGTNGSFSADEYSYLISTLKKNSERVIACTLPVLSDKNRVISDVTAKTDVELCDINKHWDDIFFLKDGVHPNYLGHEYIAKALLDIINN